MWVREKAKEGIDIYGVTTGFNACLSKRTNQLSVLQEALIQCLLSWVLIGPTSSSTRELSPTTTRCAMFLRINSFIYGCSWIRWEIMEALKQLINTHVMPKFPLHLLLQLILLLHSTLLTCILICSPADLSSLNSYGFQPAYK